MSFKGRVTLLADLAVRQVSAFLDIFLLKLRIIGFDNKRSGLYTRLGEAVFRAVNTGAPPLSDHPSNAIIEEIRESGAEITAAEDAIISRKTRARADYDNFLSLWRRGAA
ncbi:MAG: hypothetical protein HY804_02955 [Nitrospinae bacterium]|nr:hypothetical protein [Nitrospinota bacterium]